MMLGLSSRKYDPRQRMYMQILADKDSQFQREGKGFPFGVGKNVNLR